MHYDYSTSGWKNMILGVVGDESAALDRFFELLDEHAERHGRVVVRLEGHQKSYRKGESMQLLRYPNRILLIAYTDDPGFLAVSDEPGCELPGLGWGFYATLESFESEHEVDRSQWIVTDTEIFDRWSKGE